MSRRLHTLSVALLLVWPVDGSAVNWPKVHVPKVHVPNLIPHRGKCGDCEYKGPGGMCFIKSGCVLKGPLDPGKELEAAKKIADGVAHHDGAKIKQGIGASIVDSVTCVWCRSVQHTLLPGMSDEEANSLVGEGFLFLWTEDPVFVAVMTNGSLVQDKVDPSAGTVIEGGEGAPDREAVLYKSKAKCAARAKDGTIWVGWHDPLQLEAPDGTEFNYPEVDLRPGDTVSVTADKCASWTNSDTGQEAISAATLRYAGVSSRAGPKDSMVWFMKGEPDVGR